jgi:cyclophilin family peptidyl-prolyl cis-trans isomerase
MSRRRRKSHRVRNGLIALAILAFIVSTVAVAYQINNTKSNGGVSDENKVLLVTSMGNITIELYDDMPITTGNFRNLVKAGDYDGTLFNRVARGFVIQGGDVSAKGIVVPPIKDELPNKHSNVRGAVAMAKTSQPNSATSQFFIDLNDTNAAQLDGFYSVFGYVTDGMDVVDAISRVPINPVNGPDDGSPITPVTIITARFIS